MQTIHKANTSIIQFEEHKEFAIRRITRLPEQLQTRSMAVDPVWSKHYAGLKANGSPFPEVTLFYDEATDRYLLADGYTRVHAAESLGLKTIPAVIRVGGIQEAMLYSIEANLAIETRVATQEDRIHAAKMMIRVEEYRIWPDRRIALKVGLSSTKIRKLRLELQQQEGVQLPQWVMRFDKNGNPTKRRCLYVQGIKASSPPMHGGSGAFGFSHDGITKRISCDVNEAKEQFARLQQEVEETSGMLKTGGNTRQWMLQHGIEAKALETKHLMVSKISGAIVANCGSPEDYHRAVSSILHASKCVDRPGRLIVLGYARSPATTHLFPMAQSFGIEFMRPSEFLAEFGPKGDGQEPS